MKRKFMRNMYEEKEDHEYCNFSHKTCMKNDHEIQYM